VISLSEYFSVSGHRLISKEYHLASRPLPDNAPQTP